MMEYINASKEQVHAARLLLGNPYALLDENGQPDAIIVINRQPKVQPIIFKKRNTSSAERDRLIAAKARELQKKIWEERMELWPDGVPSDPVDLLDPSIAARMIGYEYQEVNSLGVLNEYDSSIEVAGIIDRPNKKIIITGRLPPNILRFSGAHEIGHALIHEGMSLHRDVPADGCSRKVAASRNSVETEADKFAAYFLMPEKLVKERFFQMFGVQDKFQLTEDAIFAFGQTELADAASKCKSSDCLAKILAKTQRYNGHSRSSLAERFRVSVGAMAIRLKELGLV